MLAVDWITLAEMFEHAAAVKRREDQAIVNIRQDIEKDQRKADHREKEQAVQDRMAAAVQAQAQAVEFSHKLDTYDTATVDALMENEQALRDVRARREAMEDAAYTLPDGRKVFKSDDGQKVFDKAGAEVPRDVIHPESIPDTLPHDSAYRPLVKEENQLLQTEEKLHQYQVRLDDARERLNKGGMTPAEMTKSAEDLKRDMPDAVRRKVGQDAASGLDIKPDLIQPDSIPAVPEGHSNRSINPMLMGSQP